MFVGGIVLLVAIVAMIVQFAGFLNRKAEVESKQPVCVRDTYTFNLICS